jgi:hypothetical protein
MNNKRKMKKKKEKIGLINPYPIYLKEVGKRPKFIQLKMKNEILQQTPMKSRGS